MADRAHLTQQDEAFCQSRLDDHARTVVLHIADTLSRIQHWHAMDPGIREARPLAVAEELYGTGPYAEQVEAAAQALMPHIDRDITRGEYALILRRAAGKVDA